MNEPSSHPSEPLAVTTTGSADSVVTGIVYGLLAAVVWGISPVMIRLGVIGALDPYDLTALRFLISGLILLPLVVRRGLGGLGWGVTLIMVGGAGVPFILVMASGMTFAPAGHGGVIVPSTMLSCAMLGGWLILGDRPSIKRLMGYAVILAGIGLIGREGVVGSFNPDAWIGDLMFIASGFFWAMYTVAARIAKVDPLHATALVAVISMALYLPAYFIWSDLGVFDAPISEILLQGFFQGVVTAILALFFYTRAVACLGAARGAVFAALVPGLTIIFAYPVLGEVPSWMELAGVIVVSGGMVYALGLTRIKFTGSDPQADSRG